MLKLLILDIDYLKALKISNKKPLRNLAALMIGEASGDGLAIKPLPAW